MAVLTEAQRLQVWRGIMRYWSHIDENISGIVKQDIKDAVDTTDVWINTHEGNTSPDTIGFNNSLPATFKANATADQKSDLFILTAARRRSVEMLKLIFAEID